MSGSVDIENRLVHLFRNSDEGREHVRFFASIPEELVPFMPGFWWNQDQLFALDLAEEIVPVQSLSHLLAVPIWRATEESELFSVTGQRILATPESFGQHWRRVMAVDLSYPVILFRRDDSAILLDGYHRLLKSVHEGHSEIRGGYITGDQIETILERQGFLGTLNEISQCDPGFIGTARQVAISLLREDPDGIYPEWT